MQLSRICVVRRRQLLCTLLALVYSFSGVSLLALVYSFSGVHVVAAKPHIFRRCGLQPPPQEPWAFDEWLVQAYIVMVQSNCTTRRTVSWQMHDYINNFLSSANFHVSGSVTLCALQIRHSNAGIGSEL